MSTASQERQERKVTLVLDDDSFLEKAQDSAEDASNFLELSTALARRKWFLLKLTLAAAAIGAIVAFLLPNRYTAETKILPPQQQAQSSATALLSSLGGGNLGSLASAAGIKPSRLRIAGGSASSIRGAYASTAVFTTVRIVFWKRPSVLG